VLLSAGTVTAASLLTHQLDAGPAARMLHCFVSLDVPASSRRVSSNHPSKLGLIDASRQSESIRLKLNGSESVFARTLNSMGQRSSPIGEVKARRPDTST
jgi:hypothetical protein